MANNVLPSQGTGIFIKAGAGASTKIGGITEFSGLGSGSAAVIDVTDVDSVAKEKLIGVMDEGSFKIGYNVIPTDAGQGTLESARLTRTLAEMKVVAGTTTYAFNAWVLTNEKGGAVDKQWTGSASLEITGIVTKTIGS